MRLYLDASVVVALVTKDIFTVRAESYLRACSPVLIVSDFAAAEFASVIARRVRLREITEPIARMAFAALDVWMARATERVDTTTLDVAAAEAALRRLDLPLRTADALNIAIAGRINATLRTFDEKMAASAKAVGLDVAPA